MKSSGSSLSTTCHFPGFEAQYLARNGSGGVLTGTFQTAKGTASLDGVLQGFDTDAGQRLWLFYPIRALTPTEVSSSEGTITYVTYIQALRAMGVPETCIQEYIACSDSADTTLRDAIHRAKWSVGVCLAGAYITAAAAGLCLAACSLAIPISIPCLIACGGSALGAGALILRCCLTYDNDMKTALSNYGREMKSCDTAMRLCWARWRMNHPTTQKAV
jgi:hypothetical protein